MLGLNSQNISYLITSANNDVVSVLYAKDYQIVPIKGYYQGQFEDISFTFGKVDNDVLRKDALFLLNHFHLDSAIIKYIGESNSKRIFKDGSESLLDIDPYNTDSNNVSYIYKGHSFSFVETVRYWRPIKKEMI